MKHDWRAITATPVLVLINTEGEPITMVDPDVQALANIETRYGCWTCMEPLTAESFATVCLGDPET